MRNFSSEELVTWRFGLTSIPKSSVDRISNKDLDLEGFRKIKGQKLDKVDREKVLLVTGQSKAIKSNQKTINMTLCKFTS